MCCASMPRRDRCLLQGDKLLRLPSQTYDTKDLVRNMSVNADGPEEIIEADEYLQPQLIGGATADVRIRPQHQANGKLDKVGYVSM